MLTFPSPRRFLFYIAGLTFAWVIIGPVHGLWYLPSSEATRRAKTWLSASRSTVRPGDFTILNATTHPHLFTSHNETYIPSSQDAPIPPAHPIIKQFITCPLPPNPHTNHIRLPNTFYNISLTPSSPQSHHIKRSTVDSGTRFFNPALIPLPYWSHPARYVLVSRVVTSGFHQESHICLADICHLRSPTSKLPPDARACSPTDIDIIGPAGGLRCITTPVKINIPPTPAKKCEGAWLAFPDIPGFHDPRVFWSGKGEPLIEVNSASLYGCVGLWIVDLRSVYPALGNVLQRGRAGRVLGKRDDDGGEEQDGRYAVEGIGGKPLMSYPHLTEITRNPRASRASVEKNWVLWFPNGDEAFVQYDLLGHVALEEEAHLEGDDEEMARLGQAVNLTEAKMNLNSTNTNLTTNFSTFPNFSQTTQRPAKRWTETPQRSKGRTFAQLTGNGFTTPNLTHPSEQPCFSAAEGHFKDSLGRTGHWHQGSNSLRLILCTRAQARGDPACRDTSVLEGNETGAVENGRSVHFAIMHRKFSNDWDLPLRYERYVVVWEGREPFQILGVSRFPISMKGEWARPWTEEENWPGSTGLENWRWSNTSLVEGRGSKKDVVRRATTQQVPEEEDFEKSSAGFTYTPSLAWTWRPHSSTANQEDEEEDAEYMSQLGTGYLGEEMLVGIGLDDVNQAFARVKVEDLLQCLRLCPGVRFAEDED